MNGPPIAGNLLSVEVLRQRRLELIQARAVIERNLRRVNGVLRARDPLATDLQQNHGTPGGYSSHFVTWQTQPCAACKRAHAKAARDRRLWRREQKNTSLGRTDV